MKRTGQLIESIADWSNLREALAKASRGKLARPDCQAFRRRWEAELAALRAQILSGHVRVGDYRFFRVHDPKEREICAAAFGERVLHHALMNVCEPILDRSLIHDTYACRKGKGRLAALHRAQSYARMRRWHLKLDIKKFFDSIPHDRLLGLLERKFKDRILSVIFRRIVGSYEKAPGRGLPIGNLTSQHFANAYLDRLDRFVKEEMRVACYVRYMDDFVLWSDSKEALLGALGRLSEFLANGLGLRVKASWRLNRSSLGLEFLGFRVFPGHFLLNRAGKRRLANRFRACQSDHLTGRMRESDLQARLLSLFEYARRASTQGLRARMIERFGVVA